MKELVICVGLWMLCALSSQAATLTPIADQAALGAVVKDVALPTTLAKDLASGFENRVLIRVLLRPSSASSPPASLGSVDVVITVKYDLWEERYTVRHRVGDRLVQEMVMPTAPEVLTYLATLRLERLFPLAGLPSDSDLTMHAELLINPIERERIERLREWVAANSAPRDAVGPAADAFTPRPNDLFNSIFEQYTQGVDVASPWRLTVISKVFRLTELANELPIR